MHEKVIGDSAVAAFGIFYDCGSWSATGAHDVKFREMEVVEVVGQSGNDDGVVDSTCGVSIDNEAETSYAVAVFRGVVDVNIGVCPRGIVGSAFESVTIGFALFQSEIVVVGRIDVQTQRYSAVGTAYRCTRHGVAQHYESVVGIGGVGVGVPGERQMLVAAHGAVDSVGFVPDDVQRIGQGAVASNMVRASKCLCCYRLVKLLSHLRGR